MKDKILHIIQPSACPTQEQLELYAQEKLPATERHSIEAHLVSCEMCQDVVEGFSLLENPERLDIVATELKSKLHQLLKEKTSRRLIPYIAIAASILLIIGIFTLLLVQKSYKKQEISLIIKPDTAVIPLTKPEKREIITHKNIEEPKTIEIKPEITIENEPNAMVQESLVEVPLSNPQATTNSELTISKLSKPAFHATANGQKFITGIIKDENGNGIPGATITIKGTTRRTVTDLDGKFQLQINSHDSLLSIDYVGYLSLEKSLKADSIVDVKLQPNLVALDEVVVVGYGIQKKSDLTGAVSRVEGISISRRMAKNEKLSQEIDSINLQLKTSPNNLLLKRSLLEKYLQLQDQQKSLDIIDELMISISDQTLKIQLSEILQLVQNKKYKKALNLLRKTKELH